ncbi:drug resistance transporter, EmrB/QacA subfamily [Lactobacillus bombicola]|uniref:Drug resistance transporter, EmrB/QacA subfamily n=1 Tax=Lactobacillus bombicola TaxID=1505723 RepID=A0A1I1R7B5_9LACO|nr:MFS transporter [Lactobacillus bombicola]SFD30216.1 drug resistance transporter, EmrB/QacA subfamily [Lactobacillus bombicola]
MKKNQKLIMSIVAIGTLSFLGIVIETALNIAFPKLMVKFKIPASTVQWLTTGYMLVSTVIIPFGAYLRKRFRAITLFRVAIISFLIGTVLAGVTSSFFLLLCGRIIQGIADGIGLPLMFSIILEQSPKKKVGFFMGLGSLVIAFAPAIGPVYGGIVLKYYSWQTLFILIIPIVLVIWLLGEFSITQKFNVFSISFDYRGGITLTGLLIITLLLIVSTASKSNYRIFLLLTAIICCILFIYFEKNNKNYIIDISLFKNRQFDIFLISFFLLQLMSLSMSYLMPNVLEIIFHLSTAKTGLLVLPAAVIDAIMSAVAGIIYDKLNHDFPILLGEGLICVSFLLANIISVAPINLIIIYSIFMFGLGLSYSNIMTRSLANLPIQSTNDGNVIYMTAQSYSGAMGTAIAASILTFTQNDYFNFINGTLAGLKINFKVLFFLSIIVLIFCTTIILRDKKMTNK